MGEVSNLFAQVHRDEGLQHQTLPADRYKPANDEKSGVKDLNSLHLHLRLSDASLILYAHQY